MKAKIVLLCTALLLATGLVLAQPPRPERSGPDPLGGNLFPPELIMRNQKAIGLTEEQKTSIRSELLKAQTRFTELQWQLQDEVESMVSLLKQNSVDEEQALAQLDKVLAAEREVKRGQIQLMIRIKNQLTPEQQAQLREIRATSGPAGRFRAVPGIPIGTVPGTRK